MTTAGTLQVSQLDMQEYRARIRHLPMPSPTQARAFAEKLSGAHSWYKHLQVMRGNGGFCFYLDPNAGKNVWWDEQQGLPRIETIHPEDRKLHYSQMATASAIEQFGYLDYCRLRQDSIDTLQRPISSPWITDGERVFAVPPEVLKRTYVGCSALLHPHSQSLRHVFRLDNFRALADAGMASHLHTPEDRRLAEIIRACNDDYDQSGSLQDEYAAIANAARDRQLSEIARAIEGLRDLLS